MNSAIVLLAQDNKTEIENITRKLMKLTPGGRNLTPDAAVQLAVASLITGANPFNGEIYITDYGIMLGYPYYIRKGTEQIERETGKPGSIQADYRTASHEDALFDESKNDVAWTCSLTDTATFQQNFDKTIELFKLLTSNGIDGKEAWKMAGEKVGDVYHWEASAVVYGSEKFGKDGSPERWDRNERCKKRALKWALKKRFANLDIASTEGDTVIIEGEALEVVDKITQEIVAEAGRPRRSADVAMQELGYEPEYIDPEPPEEESKRPYAPDVLREMIEQAAKIKGSANGFGM